MIKKLWPHCKEGAYLVILLISIELFERFSGHGLVKYGIYPRDWRNIFGIISGPLIHSDWMHLINNCLSLLPIITILHYFHLKQFYSLIGIFWIGSGIFIWLFAREGYHIGFSGIIYAVITYLLTYGIFTKDRTSIFISLLVLLYNGGYFIGFGPSEEVSWQGHLYGAILGLILAYILRQNVQIDVSNDTSDPIPFFNNDTFLLTKRERFLKSLQDEEE